MTLPPKDPGATETPLDMAWRHVVEVEAAIDLQHRVLMRIDADTHPEVAAVAQQVLVTMEISLSAMLSVLQAEEHWQTQRTGWRN